MSRLEFKRLELINGAEVSGSVSSGEFLVILGRNGTGKSLLLKTLMGLLPAKSGTILLDGMPLAEANARRRKAGHDGTGRNWGTGGLFAYVPQSFKIGFPLTVQETVALGRARGLFGLPGTSDGKPDGKQGIRNDVDAILGKLGIRHLRDSGTDKISGGELALVSLARALMQGGGFLVLDEPEANLDVSKKAEFYRLIRNLLIVRKIDTVDNSAWEPQGEHNCEQLCEYHDDKLQNSVNTPEKSVNNSVNKTAEKTASRVFNNEAGDLPGILFVTHDPLFALNLKGCSGHVGAFLKNGEFREYSAEDLNSEVLEDIYATPAEIRESPSGIRYPVFSDLLGSLL